IVRSRLSMTLTAWAAAKPGADGCASTANMNKIVEMVDRRPLFDTLRLLGRPGEEGGSSALVTCSRSTGGWCRVGPFLVLARGTRSSAVSPCGHSKDDRPVLGLRALLGSLPLRDSAGLS